MRAEIQSDELAAFFVALDQTQKKSCGLQEEPPFFSQKNAQNLDTSPVFPYSPQTSDMRHEIELVVGLKHE